MGIRGERKPDLIEPDSGFRYLPTEIQDNIGRRAAAEIDAMIEAAEADPTYTDQLGSLPDGVGETHAEDLVETPWYRRAARFLVGKSL